MQSSVLRGDVSFNTTPGLAGVGFDKNRKINRKQLQRAVNENGR